MGFWTLVEGLLLFVNAFAILNEDRFLTPRGLSFEATTGRGKSLKQQAVGLIYVAQYFRLPLILLNIIIIILKLVSG
ncbi:Immediate early response 3-interacting protein 1 [Bienertia sinuspersici]